MKDGFAGYKIFTWQFFLSALWIWHLTAFWPPLFLMRSHIRVSFCVMIPFLWLFPGFSHWLSAFLPMCLDVDIFVYILFGISWASWTCRLIFSRKSGKFLASIFSVPLSPLLWHSYYMYVAMLKHITYLLGALLTFIYSIFSLFYSCIIY